MSQDIFTHEQKDYLVTVCHFSDWIEVDELQDTLSATVINKTKAHFARFGIPQICHTDNGSQFASKKYENFAIQYGFKHTTSSPYHPQGNGRAEASVKVAKSTLKKLDCAAQLPKHTTSGTYIFTCTAHVLSTYQDNPANTQPPHKAP